MDCLILIICLSVQFLILTSSLTVFVYLFKRKDKFPYANVSPLWTITFLFCLFIQQVFGMFILTLHQIIGIINWMNFLNLINVTFIHYVLIWPILGRVYYISKCMKFNYSFLTKKRFLNYMLNDNDLDFNSHMYLERRTTYLAKMIFFPLFGLFLLFLILSLINYTRCYLYAFNYLYEAIVEECGDIISNFVYSVLSILRLIVDFVQMIFLMTFLTFVLMYPLKRDQFKFKCEMCALFIIWFIFHHLYHSLYLFQITGYDPERNLMVNLVEECCYIVLYIYLINMRNKINENDFYSMLHNYDLFMRNPVCFNFFRNYIKSTAEDEYFLLFFYIEYQYYKKLFYENKQEDLNRENANLIFHEYFASSDRHAKLSSTKYERTHSYSAFNTPASIYVIPVIDFPIDVIEKIEEYSKDNFNLPSEVLYNIFDEAYSYVNSKLYNRFLSMVRDEEEYLKFGKLICYFDFDFQLPEMK